jgi:hypothetical protein
VTSTLGFPTVGNKLISPGAQLWEFPFLPTHSPCTSRIAHEIRSSNNAALKPDVGFPTQDAAKMAGREDAKKMKNPRQPDWPEIGPIMVGQNAEKA